MVSICLQLAVGGVVGLLVGIAVKKLEQWWYSR